MFNQTNDTQLQLKVCSNERKSLLSKISSKAIQIF